MKNIIISLLIASFLLICFSGCDDILTDLDLESTENALGTSSESIETVTDKKVK